MWSGSIPELGHREPHVPVILVQNPGFQHSCLQHQPAGGGSALDFGSGWDLILPAGWSMAFWIALVYRGTKPVGLREQHSLAFEAGDLTFPDSCPDTPSGVDISLSRATELSSAYSRRPPAKRCNYDKMGVMAPFHCPWLELVQGWMGTDEGGKRGQFFYCVRSRKLLRLLNDVCAGVRARSEFESGGRTSLSAALLECGPGIVKVHVLMMGRGAPDQHALICLPTREDILQTTDRKKLGGRSIVEDPAEPLHRKFSSTEAGGSNAVDVLGSTVRPTIGFVVEGGFSHAAARGSGVGFVCVRALDKLLQGKPDPAACTIVLVRCTHSLQYRPAVLRVVV